MMNKDLQGAFKRWEMTSFGDERPSTLAARIKEKEEEENRAQAAAAGAAAARAQQFAAEQAAAAM
ncbi:MAG TPA: flagellar assembly protein FliH, partial [Massilia sp.]|nr:flagellar assembly protein FliH [Massilia sp.]